MTDAPQVDPEVDDVDEQHAVRLGKREQMLAAGIDPFPVTLPIRLMPPMITIPTIRAMMIPDASRGIPKAL